MQVTDVIIPSHSNAKKWNDNKQKKYCLQPNTNLFESEKEEKLKAHAVYITLRICFLQARRQVPHVLAYLSIYIS